MRKLVLLAYLLIMTSLLYAEPIEIGGLYYNIIEKGGIAEVSQVPQGKNNYNGDIVIPSKIEYNEKNYNVTVIGEYAFHDSDIKSVTIPSTITTIKREAFIRCSSLRDFNISDLEAWCRIDFGFNCINLEEHHINLNGVEITELVIPDGIESIPDLAFSGCINIISVKIPEGVKSIGESTFNCCKNLKSISFPNSLTSIGEGGLRDCGFDSFSFSDGITDLGMYVLCACQNLKQLSFPNKLETIKGYSCRFCPNLSSITIGENVKEIQYEAFADCPEIENVYCFAKDVPNTKDNVPFRNSYIEFATLHVPAESVDKYKADSEFGQFGSIVAITDSEMTNINAVSITPHRIMIYTLDGIQHKDTQKGLNIIKSEDGKTRKIYIRK